ncbi:MAG: hypothetical protein GYB33_16775 [Gammaproteobacteria bacterium]|nr:hypothetical protein [Gammaproteobacteria bacterium]
MLADDHDILQESVWDNAGDGSELPTEEEGGYRWDKDVVRMMFRFQHGHNVVYLYFDGSCNHSTLWINGDDVGGCIDESRYLDNH